MTHFTLDAVQARHGDALVVRWGDDTEDHMMLVDGGWKTVWRTSVRAYLQRLAGTTLAGQQLQVELAGILEANGGGQGTPLGTPRTLEFLEALAEYVDGDPPTFITSSKNSDGRLDVLRAIGEMSRG